MMKDQILPNNLLQLSCRTQGKYSDAADVYYLWPWMTDCDNSSLQFKLGFYNDSPVAEVSLS